MAIDTPFDSALRRKYNAAREKEQNYEPVSAGRFEKPPARMSMLSIRERPVEYIPNEKAKEFLRDFYIQTGLPLTVKPGQGDERSFGTGFGYYQPLGAGGSIDPRGRTVYLDPKNADLGTLIHEAGHAQDPNLYNRAIEEGLDRDKFFTEPLKEDESVGDNLRRFISMTGPRSRLEAETVAQKYVVDYLKGKGYSDDQIKSMDLQRTGDYGLYPYSYIDKGFRYRERIGPQNLPTMPDANTVDESIKDRFMQYLGDLYTTPGYLEERDAIASEALAFLEGNLGRFTEAGEQKPSEMYTRTVFDY